MGVRFWKPRKPRYFEKIVLSFFQQSRPDCKIESNVITGRQKKIDCFGVDGICYHCNTVFEAGCYYHYCPCQEARPSLTDTDIEKGITKRQQNEMRRDYIQQKCYQIVEMWECEWWSLSKTKCITKKSPPRNFSLQTTFEWRTTLARNYRWATLWLCSMWYWSSRASEKSFLNLSSDIQKSRS